MTTQTNWPVPRDIDEAPRTEVLYFTRFPDAIGLWQVLEPWAWPMPTEVRL